MAESDLRALLRKFDRNFTAEEVRGLEDPPVWDEWMPLKVIAVAAFGLWFALFLDGLREGSGQSPTCP